MGPQVERIILKINQTCSVESRQICFTHVPIFWNNPGQAFGPGRYLYDITFYFIPYTINQLVCIIADSGPVQEIVRLNKIIKKVFHVVLMLPYLT